MDFNGNWDILGMIMEMKEKAEYEDKVEKLARKNFSFVLNHIKKSGSFDFEVVESEGFNYLELSRKYKLDKSKLFFVNKKGHKIYPKNIRKSESFIDFMEDKYEEYKQGMVTDVLTYASMYYPIHESREYPNGLSLEQFTEHYIWDNGIHYTIRYSDYTAACYYCDYYYQQERCKEVLSMSDYLYNPRNRYDKEIHMNKFSDSLEYLCLDRRPIFIESSSEEELDWDEQAGYFET